MTSTTSAATREKPTSTQRTRWGEAEFGEEREGCAIVGPVRDAEDARDDGDGAAERMCVSTQDFGEAVGQEDERGDEQEPGQAAGHAKAHDVASVAAAARCPFL